VFPLTDRTSNQVEGPHIFENIQREHSEIEHSEGTFQESEGSHMYDMRSKGHTCTIWSRKDYTLCDIKFRIV